MVGSVPSLAQQIISETDKLSSLGKMYGFLKYYHPEVGSGQLDWDQEFFEILPEVIKASDKTALSTVYLNWIESLGEVDECKRCDSEKNYFDKNFDLSWTQDTTQFTKDLTSKLKYIEENRNLKENYYVTTEYLGQIKVINEPIYEGFEYPNEDYRLLGLFKYWNIIEYFFPYKYLTDQDWDLVLNDMIPKFRKAKNISDYQNSIKELVAKLDDSHAYINFNEQPKKFLPVMVSHVEGRAVISDFYNDSIAALNNLKLGDVILKVNGLDVEKETEKNSKYVAGSHQRYKINRAYSLLAHSQENDVELTIQRDGEVFKIKANRYDFNDFDYLKCLRQIKSKSISQDIGYINMAARFTFKEFDDIFELFKDKTHILVDLRAYPQLKYTMFTRYFNSERRVFAKKYKPDLSYPGKFVFKDDVTTNKSRKAFKGKFILLVNENSMSLSEFTAMAFQTADDVITIGNQTAAADGEVVVFNYLGGYKTTMTGNGVLYPDGTETQRKGVRIDVEVNPTIKGLRQGRDEVLEKAIEIATE
jgi:C-terminal processing protease CtpA/Prc